VMNSTQAMSGVSGRPRVLTIRSGSRMLDDNERSVVLEVRDTGPGIDPGSAAKLFTAFHTTKANGMGMGLSISRSIVEAHGGSISISPEITDGACFIVRLPAMEEALQ
jgi:two-component system, LuxR family, sensor kinase FixL